MQLLTETMFRELFSRNQVKHFKVKRITHGRVALEGSKGIRIVLKQANCEELRTEKITKN
jgi:hypothetical protein